VAPIGTRRTIVIVATAAFVGPKIFLLLPVWFLGVAVYFWRTRWSEHRALAFIQFNISISLRARMIAAWPTAMAGLGGANEFLGD
jgi:hypothetical protein